MAEIEKQEDLFAPEEDLFAAPETEEDLFAPEEATLTEKVGDFAEEAFLGAATGIREQIGGAAAAVPFILGDIFDVPSLKEPFRSFRDSAKFVTPEDPGLTFEVSANIFNTLTNAFLFKGKAINAMGLEAALTSMADSLETGHSLGRSLFYGAMVGGAEIYTETAGGQIPALLAKHPGVKRVVMSVAKDTGMEMLNWLWQRGVLDPAVLKEEFPSLGEIWDGMSKTGTINIISAGLLGGSKLSLDRILAPTIDTTSTLSEGELQEMQSRGIEDPALELEKAKEGLSEVDRLLEEKIKPKDFGKITHEPLAEARPEDIETRIALGEALFPERKRPVEIVESKELKKIAKVTDKLYKQQQLIQDQKHIDARKLGVDFSEPEFLATSLTEEIGKEVSKRKRSAPSKKMPGLIKDVQEQQSFVREMFGKPRRPAHAFRPSKTIAKPWEMLPEDFQSFYSESVQELSDQGEFVFPHEQIVETALRQGKIIPDEVINRYPRLKDAFYIYTADDQDNLMSSIESNLAEYAGEVKADTEDRRIPFLDMSLPPTELELAEQFVPPPDPVEIDTTVEGLVADLQEQTFNLKDLTQRQRQAVRADALTEFPELAQDVEKPKTRDDPLRLKSEMEKEIPNKQQDVEKRTDWDNDPVTKVIEESTVASKKAKKLSVDKMINILANTFADDKAAAKRALHKTGDPIAAQAKVALENMQGAGDEANLFIEEVLSTTTRDLNNRQYKKLNTVVHNMRLIELAVKEKRFKGQKGITAKQAKDNLDRMFEDDPEEFKNIVDRARKVWGVFEGELQRLAAPENNQLVSPESLQAIKDSGKVYAPRQMIDYIDGADRKFFNGKVSVPDSGLQRLKDLPDGEEILGFIETDVDALIKTVVTRTRHRIATNEVSVEMYNLALNEVNTDLAKIALPNQKTPKGYQRFSAVVDGQTKEYFVLDEVARDFVKNDPVINSTVARTIELLSGVWILRPMAVGMNPAFAFWNLPRDATHAWLAGGDKIWSPHAPIALYEMGKDYASVFKDVHNRTGIFKEAIGNKIGMKMLAAQARPQETFKEIPLLETRKTVLKPLAAFIDGLNKMITTSEYWGRTAAYKRAKDNGFTGKQAANISRNLLDHNQGGALFKALNPGVAFIKSGSQATRSVVRSTWENPGLMAYKTAQLGMLSLLLKGAWKFMLHKEDLPDGTPGGSFADDIDDHTLRTKFVIPTGITFKDDEGQERAVAFLLPKDEAIQPFTTAFEQSWDVWVEDKPFDEEAMSSALVAAIPATPIEISSPTYDAALGLHGNFDTYRLKKVFNRTNGEIDPMHEVIPGKTPEAYKVIARGIDKIPILRQMLPPSPVRLQYAFEQFFTRGNVWTAIAGYPIKKILEEEDSKAKQEAGKTLWQDLAKTPILKRFLYITNPNNKIDKAKKTARLIENTRRWELKVTAEELWDNRAAIGGKDSWQEFFNGLDKGDQKSVARRIERNEQLGQLDLQMSKAFWQRFVGTQPQLKAYMLLNEWSTSEAARKSMIQHDLDILASSKAKKTGILTNKTKTEFNKLRQKQIRERGERQ